MNIYHIGAWAKIIVGGGILVALYHMINPYEDTALALSFGLLGIFVLGWGLSFYMFLGFQHLLTHDSLNKKLTTSYQLSLLFGFYLIINLLIILTDNRSKSIGFLILLLFIGAQIIIVKPPKLGPSLPST